MLIKLAGAIKGTSGVKVMFFSVAKLLFPIFPGVKRLFLAEISILVDQTNFSGLKK